MGGESDSHKPIERGRQEGQRYLTRGPRISGRGIPPRQPSHLGPRAGRVGQGRSRCREVQRGRAEAALEELGIGSGDLRTHGEKVGRG